MPKIKIDSGLFDRIKQAAEQAGYANVEEFVIHVFERELEKMNNSEASDKVDEQLRGLGYIE